MTVNLRIFPSVDSILNESDGPQLLIAPFALWAAPSGLQIPMLFTITTELRRGFLADAQRHEQIEVGAAP